MGKSNRRTRRTVRLADRGAAEVEQLRRAAVPADLGRLLAGGRGAEYYEGLLVGCVYAPRVAKLIELMTSNDVEPRWRRLELRYADRHVVIDGEARQLAPADFAFYALMVRRRIDARGFVTWNTAGLAHEYLTEYRRLADSLNGNRERLEARLERDGIERQWFEERKCKVNRAVRPLGGWTGCDYRIVSRGARPNTRSGVVVDPGCIRFHDKPSGEAEGAAPAAADGGSAAARADRARSPPDVAHVGNGHPWFSTVPEANHADKLVMSVKGTGPDRVLIVQHVPEASHVDKLVMSVKGTGPWL